jgi:hypothetical protein
MALDPIMRERRLPSLDALPFITNVKPASDGIRVNHRDLNRAARDLVICTHR